MDTLALQVIGGNFGTRFSPSTPQPPSLSKAKGAGHTPAPPGPRPTILFSGRSSHKAPGRWPLREEPLAKWGGRRSGVIYPRQTSSSSHPPTPSSGPLAAGTASARVRGGRRAEPRASAGRARHATRDVPWRRGGGGAPRSSPLQVRIPGPGAVTGWGGGDGEERGDRPPHDVNPQGRALLCGLPRVAGATAAGVGRRRGVPPRRAKERRHPWPMASGGGELIAPGRGYKRALAGAPRAHGAAASGKGRAHRPGPRADGLGGPGGGGSPPGRRGHSPPCARAGGGGEWRHPSTAMRR